MIELEGLEIGLVWKGWMIVVILNYVVMYCRNLMCFDY